MTKNDENKATKLMAGIPGAKLTNVKEEPCFNSLEEARLQCYGDKSIKGIVQTNGKYRFSESDTLLKSNKEETTYLIINR